ncbi:hypothetical protein [Actinomycetospora sp. TBRC 11914]|nr:hypothetical protein [Actinomycetospora sp. TBRC 11914]NMO88216.1 hypothetical protein [Actinomycetospora sp. TBRC 11914]
MAVMTWVAELPAPPPPAADVPPAPLLGFPRLTPPPPPPPFAPSPEPP